ncbi:MAG: TIGR02300 family protein [Alphaproteobacteria bacterium]|nr:TIGR02300 family protein [Alphaproteobacteria bacterium]
MVKPEWGTKRRCLDCGAFFYDMRKDPIVCPKCGHSYTLAELLEKQQAALLKSSKRKAKEIDLLDEDSEVPSDVILDDSFEDEDLSEDEDDDTLLEEDEDLEGENPDQFADVIPIKRPRKEE